MMRRALPLLILLLAACSDGRDQAPLRVDVAGEAPRLADPSTRPPSPEAVLLLDATAQGLVALDAEGQVEPALAKRWTVLDDGLSYIFRLDDFEWGDGSALTASQAARQLRAASRAGSRNRLAPLLADIESANAVTPQILEVTLRRPRIDFLQLLAQPDLALLVNGAGLGPYEIADGYDTGSDMILLSPMRRETPATDEDAEPVEPIRPSETRELRFRAAATAVARYRLGQTDLVLGGGWTTLPYADAIDAPDSELVLDPVEGLFGLAVVSNGGFLGDAAGREVLSLAIDRSQLAELFGRQRSEARNAIVPESAEGLSETAALSWRDSTIAARRSFARDAVARWRQANGDIPPLRVALPDAPGSRPVFAVLRGQWRAIGIEAERVEWDEDADLRLVDRIAPSGQADWYFAQFPCGRPIACSEAYRLALQAVAEAPSDRVRAIRMTEAAAEFERMTPFIPLLRPVRWSLVSPRLTGFEANRYASHPLDRLIAPTG